MSDRHPVLIFSNRQHTCDVQQHFRLSKVQRNVSHSQRHQRARKQRRNLHALRHTPEQRRAAVRALTCIISGGGDGCNAVAGRGVASAPAPVSCVACSASSGARVCGAAATAKGEQRIRRESQRYTKHKPQRKCGAQRFGAQRQETGQRVVARAIQLLQPTPPTTHTSSVDKSCNNELDAHDAHT